jgi:hypothetical protein
VVVVVCVSRGFCNEDNLSNSAMYLNNALSLLGIASPVEDMLKMADKALPLTPVTIAQVFNCMYTLLRLRQVRPHVHVARGRWLGALRGQRGAS